LKLLIVTQYFWPENFRVNDLVMELQRRGHEVTVLTAWPNYPEGVVNPEFRAAPHQFSNYEGAEVVRVPFMPRGKGSARLVLNYMSFVASVASLGAWKLRGRAYDAVFVFQPSPITACLPAIWIGRLKRAPVVLWVLDLWPETLAAIGVVRSPRLLASIGKLVAYIYRNCALVLGQSRSFERNIAHYAGDAQRFRYFPGWAESPLQSSLQSTTVAPEMAELSDTFNVLFAGNIGDAQDFPAILDAAEMLRERRDIRWVIVGDGRAGDWVRSEIDRRGLHDSVRLLGRHPLERMPAFFRGAHALLVSLKPDAVFAMTIPGKVQTYLAAGVPLLGMLDGEGARVIEESGAGLVAPAGDSAALARNVVALAATSEAERRSMGARGIDYSRREFDRGTLVSQLEAWLGEVAAKPTALVAATR
jgi:colanic acid biosynthesis glycosyl transferase WcaI